MKLHRFIVGVFLILATQANAADRFKSGFAVESFGGNGYITNGLMVGFRSMHYLDIMPTINWGFEMMTGTARGTVLQNDNLTYGGLTINYDRTFATIFFIEAGALVGYGYGRIDPMGVYGSSMVLKPQVALGLRAIQGYRASFGVGYLYMPVAQGFNALSFTVRLERRNDEKL